MNWVKGMMRYQWTDMSSVKPEYRCDNENRKFFLNSPAGTIIFTSKDPVDFYFFRDRFINRFASGCNPEDFFDLYRDILKHKWGRKAKTKYKANLRTRLKLKCRLS